MDCLSLLALKVAPNVFDLSSGQSHISIRDQVVRGQLLVRDLREMDPDAERLLVVGAGIAGISAAVAAAYRFPKMTIWVIERNIELFGLQRDVPTRYVGPFMYEWPAIFHDDQSFPPNMPYLGGALSQGVPSWHAVDPLPARDLVNQVETWLRQELLTLGQRLRIWTGVSSEDVVTQIKRWSDKIGERAGSRPGVPAKELAAGGPVVTFGEAYAWDTENHTGPQTFAPDYVVLGAGMGNEKISLRTDSGNDVDVGLPFWADDTLRDPAAADARIGVFGGGDGALQDVLRSLTNYDHPLAMLAFLRKDSDVNKHFNAVEGLLSALEQQSRLLTTWSSLPNYSAIDQACRSIAMDMAAFPTVRQRLTQSIRIGKGIVHHFVRNDHFDKAYLLNRFLVHLLRQTMRHRSTEQAQWSGRMSYECHWKAEVTFIKPGLHKACGLYFIKLGQSRLSHTHVLDIAVVRHGLDKASIPGQQLVRVTSQAARTRVNLANIPLPFVLPK